jgi:hypothetical protein
MSKPAVKFMGSAYMIEMTVAGDTGDGFFVQSGYLFFQGPQAHTGIDQ